MESSTELIGQVERTGAITSGIESLIDKNALDSLRQALDGRQTRAGSSEKIQIPPSAEFLIPVFARALAEGREFEVSKVSIKDLKRFRPDLEGDAWLISRFSKKFAYKFDRYAQRKATERVLKEVVKIQNLIEAIGNVENPQQQFLKEVELLHQDLPQYRDYINGPFSGLLDHRLGRAFHKNPRNTSFKNAYPLISTALVFMPIRTDDLEYWSKRMDIAAPEIYAGMQIFLTNHGIEATTTYGHTQTGSPLRPAASIFKGGSLKDVKKRTPQILDALYQLLPEDGPEFKAKVTALAQEILQAKQQGASNHEIAAALTRSLNAKV